MDSARYSNRKTKDRDSRHHSDVSYGGRGGFGGGPDRGGYGGGPERGGYGGGPERGGYGGNRGYGGDAYVGNFADVAPDAPTDWGVSFRKNFYIEHVEIKQMDGKLKREIMEENQISIEMGKDVPNPVPVWDYQSFDTPLQELIAERDFVMPRPVQVLGIPVAMSGRDLIAVAETGSGKTLAFVLPGIVHLEDQPPVRPGEGPVMLVLAPTRELCQQIAQEANFFAEPRGHRVTAVYGGQGSVQQQIMALSQGSAIVVATPGRLQDLVFKRSIIDLKRVTFFVLDEADRMLDMGFIRDMQLIAKHIRADRQTLMFSATWPRSVDELAKTIFRQEDPIKMKVGYKDTSMHLVPSLTWQFINAQRDAKRRQLES